MTFKDYLSQIGDKYIGASCLVICGAMAALKLIETGFIGQRRGSAGADHAKVLDKTLVGWKS